MNWEADPGLLLRTMEAFQALALRLWCQDSPTAGDDAPTLAAIDRWAHGLPEDEHAALNAMLGENFGGRHAWDEDHPISRLIVRLTELEEVSRG